MGVGITVADAKKKASNLFSVYLDGKRIFVKRGTFDEPDRGTVINKVRDLAGWNKVVQIYERAGYYMINYNTELKYVIDVMGAGLTVYVADCIDTYYSGQAKGADNAIHCKSGVTNGYDFV